MESESGTVGAQSGASNAACPQSGTSSNPFKLNLKRFAYDVFASVFIRLGVAHFPETELRPNHYNDSTVLSQMSTVVLGHQIFQRDAWRQIFKSNFDPYSLCYFRGITEYVWRTLKRTEEHKTKDPQWMFEALFSVHIELYFYLKFRNKPLCLEELPESWCRLYSEYLSDTHGDISEFIKPQDKRFVKFLDLTVDHYLKHYCFPYETTRSSGIFSSYIRSPEVKELVESENPITLQDIEGILNIVKYRRSDEYWSANSSPRIRVIRRKRPLEESTDSGASGQRSPGPSTDAPESGQK
ncbi:hypothetical protein NPIL_299431 [Nephila pilipes]|uniref:Uncharacterized protein n=1 Tax=Nephila pilipes TaxID=299642 RepID=A0A8X6T5J9_NEPPI|nr:hypothetical protein NPIL_299431 [Nephila pilipes]